MIARPRGQHVWGVALLLLLSATSVAASGDLRLVDAVQKQDKVAARRLLSRMLM